MVGTKDMLIEQLKAERDEARARVRQLEANINQERQLGVDAAAIELSVALGHPRSELPPGIRYLIADVYKLRDLLITIRENFGDDAHLRRFPAIWAQINRAIKP